MQEENIMTVRQAIEISNTGDTSRIDEVISPNYFDNESQGDPVRSKLRGSEQFIDIVKMLRSAFAELHGKIVEHKAVRDDLRLMMQLGVVGTKAQYEALFQTWKGLDEQ